MNDGDLLKVDGLRVEFAMPAGVSKIINNLSLSFRKNAFLGLVGESGSGKTVFAYSLLGFVKPPGRIAGGEILYDGVDILTLPESELMKKYRGKEMGLIASNARAHLNPLLTVGRQLSIAFMVHTGADKRRARERALEMLKLVKINDPLRRFDSYPHELSGGMAQRIMIAMALINDPKLIIADDCTSGLDVTVAAQVMDLFQNVIEVQHASSILITHDLGVVAQYCSDVAIMYCGQIIETAPVATFFRECRHPYSRILLDSLPENTGKSGLKRVSGAATNTYELPKGCLYQSRCPVCQDICRSLEPPMNAVGEDHRVKCHFAESAVAKGGTGA